MVTLTLVIWLACAIAGGLITDHKGLGPWRGAGLGLLLGLIGVLIAVLLPRKPPNREPAS